MPVYCALCKRPFKAQNHLDQHIQNSAAHKKSAQMPQTQASLQVNLPPVNLKQQKQPSLSRTAPIVQLVKPTKQQQALDSGYQTYHTTTKYEQEHPPNAIATSSYSPQITKSTPKTVHQDVDLRWSVVLGSEHKAVLDALSAHCHPPKELEENGYIIRPYNTQDYFNSRKCKRCNSQERNAHNRECTFHPEKRNKYNPTRPYKCCRTEGRGCIILPTHDFQLPLRATKHKQFLQTPAASAEQIKFRAVTLDCEMAGIAGGASEAIFLCVTDYITGALLLKQFVCPRGKITQMRSSIHGISKSVLNIAISQGQALSGWEGARKELWKYIDDNTVLVGHALEHDLDALRIIHPRIVDSGILSRNAVGIRRIRWGLKTLCPELLNFEIRKNRGGIHDCLEDVLATREVVLFCTRKTEAFQTWAKNKRSEEIRLEKKREIARQEKSIQQARENKLKLGGEIRGSGSLYTYFIAAVEDDGEDDDGDEEILHWSDIAEDLGWPHPDTGYDPWSD